MNLLVCLKILKKYKNLIHIKKQLIAFRGLSSSGKWKMYSNNIEKVISTIGMISI